MFVDYVCYLVGVFVIIVPLTALGYLWGRRDGHIEGYDSGYKDALDFCDSDEWVEAYKEVRKENN